MAQQVKAFATRPGNLSLVPENWLYWVLLALRVSPYKYIYKRNMIKATALTRNVHLVAMGEVSWVGLGQRMSSDGLQCAWAPFSTQEDVSSKPST